MAVAQGQVDEATDLYRNALATVSALSVRDPDNAELQRDLHFARWKVTDVLSIRGDAAALLAEARTLHEAAERFAARHPDDLAWQWYAASSHERLGDALLATDAKAAAAEYRAELAGLEKLVARSASYRGELVGIYGRVGPATAQWRRDLAVCRQHLADALVSLGELDAAIAEGRASLAVMAELATQDPTNLVSQDDLRSAHGKLAWLLQFEGHTSETLGEERMELALAKAISERDPTNGRRQIALCDAHQSLGEELRAQGASDEALAEFRAAAAIADHLLENGSAVARDNISWRRDRGIAHDQIGRQLLVRGDAQGALAEYRTYQTIAQQLKAVAPTNVEVQTDLAWAARHVGEALAFAGQGDEAVEQYRAAVNGFEQLWAASRTNLDLEFAVEAAHALLGDALLVQHDVPGALAEHLTMKRLAEDLVTEDPKNAAMLHDVSGAHERIGTDLLQQQDPVGAEQHYASALSTCEASIAATHDACDNHRAEVATALLAQGKVDQALDELELAEHGLVERLAANPADAYLQGALADTHEALGEIGGLRADHARAAVEYDAARKLRTALAGGSTSVGLALAGGNAKLVRELIAIHDPARALRIAREDLALAAPALAARPNDGRWVAVSSQGHEDAGDALAAGGDPRDALEEYEESRTLVEELAKPGPHRMATWADVAEIHERIGDAHWSLGERASARAAYDRSSENLARELSEHRNDPTLVKRAETLAKKIAARAS